jgi:ABC-type glutathione transport system ATPase component
VLLLDEPTSNLDLESTQLTRQAMLKAREKWGTNLIVVSHDLDWLSRVSHQVMSIHKGKITESTQAHIA